MSETCKTCRFYANDSEGSFCHRFPPVYYRPNSTQRIIGAVPVTENYWCGEHQPIPAEPQNVTSTGDIRYA